MGKRNYEINVKTMAADLLAFKKAFDDAKIPWVITDGLVLGYARYKKIMEWDTDIDMAVCVEINGKQWQAFCNSLSTAGFKARMQKKDFICGGRLVPYNLFFLHKKGNFYECFPKSTPGLKFVEKAKWYDKSQMVEFLGNKYPMPNHMEDYLDHHYGKDWKTNIVKDHEEFFVDKRGSRDMSKWLTGRSSKNGDLWPKIIKIEDTMEN